MENVEATVNNFKNTHTTWQSKCLSYEQILEKTTKENEVVEDIHSPLKQWETAISEDGLFLIDRESGKPYEMTDRAIDTFCNVSNCASKPVIRAMLSKSVDVDGKTIPKTVEDFEIAQSYINRNIFNPNRTNQDKSFLFRTWNGNGNVPNSIRAILSERYAIINNLWYIEIINKAIPNALYSHWRGDADNMYGNILIPDTIRQESDSELGGMLSIGNSEIGMRRLTSISDT
jgi:hypothetical protein